MVLKFLKKFYFFKKKFNYFFEKNFDYFFFRKFLVQILAKKF